MHSSRSTDMSSLVWDDKHSKEKIHGSWISGPALANKGTDEVFPERKSRCGSSGKQPIPRSWKDLKFLQEYPSSHQHVHWQMVKLHMNRNFKSLSLTWKDKPQAGFVEQLALHGLVLVGISSLRSWNSSSCEHHREHSTSLPLVVFSGKSLKQQQRLSPCRNWKIAQQTGWRIHKIRKTKQQKALAQQHYF